MIARSGTYPVAERSTMFESPLTRVRRRVGAGIFSVALVGVLWMFSPGMPVLRGPTAPAELRQAGLQLFQHEWEPGDPQAGGDGLGPVFNAKSCAACHFQGGIGGGGDNSHNVTAFEALPTQERPEIKGGLIHRFAVANEFLERTNELHRIFPIVPNATVVVNGCQTTIHDFDPIHTEIVNSTALFGAGWIDRISAKTIRHQSARGQGAGRRLQWFGGGQTAHPAGRSRRQVRLESAVRHSSGIRCRGLCERDWPGKPRHASGDAVRLR
jgi:hypothetical protein